MRHFVGTVASGLLAFVALAVSWAWAQGVVLAVGAICAALVGIIALVRTVSALRPVRWVARTMIGEPIGRAFRRELDVWAGENIIPRLDAIEAEHRRNGGHSTRDRLEAVATAVGAAPPD